jgi:hypothetical protein
MSDTDQWENDSPEWDKPKGRIIYLADEKVTHHPRL